jgi:methylase of polypeptide subunit release factors
MQAWCPYSKVRRVVYYSSIAYSDLRSYRQETAASVSYLAQSLLQSWKESGLVDPTNVLDLCTGTGCIPLLFQHELFKQPNILPKIGRVVGVDISPQALKLSEDNKARQLHEQHVYGSSNPTKLDTLRNMQFVQADILADEKSSSSAMSKLREISPAKPNYEVLISNPPYISSAAFRITTAASVRRYEPKLALVPPHSPTQQIIEDGDAFYPKLYDIAKLVKSKVVLFEVADMEQACRVAAMADEHWAIVEILRDDPEAVVGETEYAEIEGGAREKVRVRGQGNGRSVVAFTTEGSRWCNTD